MRLLLKLAEQFFDARQNAPMTLGKFFRQSFNILLEKKLGPLFVRLNLCLAQELMHDAAVGAPGDFNPVKIVYPAKLPVEDVLQGFHARAGGIDQGPVDIKKQQTF